MNDPKPPPPVDYSFPSMETNDNASLSITGPTEDLVMLGAIYAEVVRARGLFPGSHDRLIAFMEEAGEIARAIYDLDGSGHSYNHFVEECIQAAATAFRLAMEGDAAFPKTLPNAYGLGA